MSKRFTDDEKWSDGWFRRLKPALKLMWLYLCDACDGAGVWEPDLEAVRFALGVRVTEEEAKAALGDRLAVLPSGKWHLTKFVAFQYPHGVEANSKPHAAIRALLVKHGLRGSIVPLTTEGSPNPTPKPLGKGMGEAIDSLLDKDKDKDKDSSSRGDARGGRTTSERLARWITVRAKDPIRESENRAALDLLVGKFGEPAVQRAAEAAAFAAGKHVYPDQIRPALEASAAVPEPEPIDPEIDSMDRMIRDRGWQAVLAAAGIGNVTSEDRLRQALTANRPVLRSLLAGKAGAA